MAKEKSTFYFLKSKKFLMFSGAILGSIIIFYLIFAIGIYRYGWQGRFTKKVASVLPYPVEIIGGSYVSYADFLARVEFFSNYQVNFNNVDLNSEEGKKKLTEIRAFVLDQLAEDFIIEKEARKRKITVSKTELDESFNDLIKANGGEEKVQENLNKYYSGISIDEYKKQYEQKYLRQKLSEAIAKDSVLDEEAKKKAESVLKELKNGADFSEMAKKYSQDESATNGGDLGFITKGKMLPEFDEVAFKLQPAQISELVKTVSGYDIIRLAEQRGEEIKVSRILFKTKDFNTWLKDKMSEYNVRKIIKI